MKIKTPLFVFYFILPFLCFGQNTSEKFALAPGANHDFKTTINSKNIIPWDGNNYLAVRSRTVNAGGALYDSDLNKIKTFNAGVKYNGNSLRFRRLIECNNDKSFIITTLRDKKAKKCYAFYNEFKRTTLKAGTPKKIIEINHNPNAYSNPQIQIAHSPDSAKIAVILDAVDISSKKEFTLAVFDNNFELLYKKEVDLDYDDNLFELKDAQIDNSGNVHILGKRNGNANRFRLLSFWGEEGGMDDFEVSIKDKFVSDIQIKLKDNQDLIGAGFFTPAFGSNTSVAGTFSFQVNAKTKKLLPNQHHLFDESFLLQDLEKGELKKQEKIISKGKIPFLKNLKLDQLEITKEGNINLIAQVFIESRAENIPSSAEDIIILQLSENGMVNWSQKIVKRQVFANLRSFFTYASLIDNDHIYILFNDAVYNTTKEELHPVAKFKMAVRSEIVLWDIDQNGEKSMHILTPEEENNIKLIPDNCHKTGSNEFVLCFSQKKNYKFLKLLTKAN